MSGIRNHSVYRIVFKYRQQIRESDGGGGSEFIAWCSELATDEWIGVFPSEEIARAYAAKRLQHSKDAELVSVERLYRLDACIIEHAY